ncbi:MAG TPA: hypothetical protein VJ508_18500 [Saprospiraceae bacterium]|nr:hypothetical protein [Saprospiraceae bacterium]
MTGIGQLTKFSAALTTRKRIFLLLFVIPLALTCKQKDDIQKDDLSGKWNIMKAERNGRETPYLRGGYFLFSKEGQMTVNITGDDESGTFTIKNNVIKLNGNKTFTLETLRPDSMILHYQINPQSAFVFYMARQHDTIQ